MKLINLSLIILFLLNGILFAQTEPVQSDKPELILILKVKESIPIGYAYRFEGEVLKVEKGLLPDKAIDITVMAGDDGIYSTFKEDEANNVFRVKFVFNKSDEPYPHAFVTGFVDSDKNSWKITKIEKI